KYSITELLDKLISFSIQHENEFLEFISIEKQKEESNIRSERFFKFITTPIEGAGPEDYEEFHYNED
ncbi:MAG: hypothetical protein ACTSRS_16935, partial [Candidatus Helarchaeota archaeon]